MPYYAVIIDGPSGGFSRYSYKYTAHSHEIAIAFGRAARQAYAESHNISYASTYERKGSFQSGLSNPGDSHELNAV